MEIYAEAPRSIEDVGSILAQQTNRQRGTHLAPHDVFSEIPDVTWTDFFEPLFTLLDWVGKYIFCGICLVTVIKFLTWLMGNLTRLYEALGEFGCSPKLLLVCMPSVQDFFGRRARTERKKNDVEAGFALLSEEERGSGDGKGTIPTAPEKVRADAQPRPPYQHLQKEVQSLHHQFEEGDLT
jgi:hypothetical protein